MIARRGFLTLALLPWAAPAVAAPAEAAPAEAALDAAIRAAVGDTAIAEGGIELRVPAVAENGAQVPLTVLVDSPLTEADHVTAIHVFAPRNPTPAVASFRLTPALARAEIQTRIRLAEAQTILVLARHSDGRVTRASAALSVTNGGCLG